MEGEPESNVVDLHEARVRKLIEGYLARMRRGESAAFPYGELLQAETNYLKAKKRGFEKQA